MILTIAIENTNTVIGGFEKEVLLFDESISTNSSRTEFEYIMNLCSILEMHGKKAKDVEGVIISSVVPPVTNSVKRAAMRIFENEPLIIGPGVKSGLNIVTDQPAQTGNDLVACAVAGIAAYEVPMIIINMGTATTLSVINERKQYVGGMIIPGMKSSSFSLAKETAQLPAIGLEKPRKAIGSNTVEAMRSGLFYGTAACVEGAAAKIEKELGVQVETLVLTGEYAKHILPYCERKMCLNEHLLLNGLRLIYEKNQK